MRPMLALLFACTAAPGCVTPPSAPAAASSIPSPSAPALSAAVQPAPVISATPVLFTLAPIRPGQIRYETLKLQLGEGDEEKTAAYERTVTLLDVDVHGVVERARVRFAQHLPLSYVTEPRVGFAGRTFRFERLPQRECCEFSFARHTVSVLEEGAREKPNARILSAFSARTFDARGETLREIVHRPLRAPGQTAQTTLLSPGDPVLAPKAMFCGLESLWFNKQVAFLERVLVFRGMRQVGDKSCGVFELRARLVSTPQNSGLPTTTDLTGEVVVELATTRTVSEELRGTISFNRKLFASGRVKRTYRYVDP